jgi:hypothetical protein
LYGNILLLLKQLFRAGLVRILLKEAFLVAVIKENLYSNCNYIIIIIPINVYCLLYTIIAILY